MTSCRFLSDLILAGPSMVAINLLTETSKVKGLNCIWFSLVCNY